MKAAPVAYSYVRFSSPEQSKGDSLRRQTEAARSWCERHDVRLDDATTLHDLGKSAFKGAHRSNPDRNALAGFLALVKSGKVPKGSYLIVEALDRLTREEIQPALLLVLNLLQAGVRVVQLSPTELVFDDRSDTLAVMMMVVELSRGHSESKVKSERVAKAWRAKMEAARTGSVVVTRQLPAWLELTDGKLTLVPERAEVVKRIYRLSAEGFGINAVVGKLTAEGVPPFGESVVREGRKRSAFAGVWTRCYVAKILRTRAAVGEFQPCSNGKPDGPPIPGYFPAVVTEQEWLAARSAAAQRRIKRGRVGKTVNVFQGLIRNARPDCGDPYILTARVALRQRKTYRRILINKDAAEGRGECWSFPYDTFERAVLSMLREIDPAELQGGSAPPDPRQSLRDERDHVADRIARLEAELLTGDVPSVVRVLRQLEERKRALDERIADLDQQAAHPAGELWTSARSLLDVLDTAEDPDDVRVRLRGILRRVVGGIDLLVHHRGRDRLAYVEIRFKGTDRVRSYAIMHRDVRANRDGRTPARWWVQSVAHREDPTGHSIRNPRRAPFYLGWLFKHFDPPRTGEYDLCGEVKPADGAHEKTAGDEGKGASKSGARKPRRKGR